MTTINARIIHLHSTTPGAVPSVQQLGDVGVLAINVADGCGYILSADGKDVVKVFDKKAAQPEAIDGGSF